TLVALGHIAEKQREVLVSGRLASVQEQSEAVALGKNLQRRRDRTEEEIVRTALPRVLSILKPEQLQRIYLLVHGETPSNAARSPLLLDPSAGFVQDTHIQILQQRLTEAQELAVAALQEQLPADATEKDRESFAAMQADQQANLQRAQAEMEKFRGGLQSKAR